MSLFLAVSHNTQCQWVALYNNLLFKANKWHSVTGIRSGLYDIGPEFTCMLCHSLVITLVHLALLRLFSPDK